MRRLLSTGLRAGIARLPDYPVFNGYHDLGIEYYRFIPQGDEGALSSPEDSEQQAG